ncbi:hypothetical protein AcV7_003740 [Taiwanofungus camphoratus]|nr:hypothetical protein AcV7_003740 [Antrodia cinnamomea]
MIFREKRWEPRFLFRHAAVGCCSDHHHVVNPRIPSNAQCWTPCKNCDCTKCIVDGAILRVPIFGSERPWAYDASSVLGSCSAETKGITSPVDAIWWAPLSKRRRCQNYYCIQLAASELFLCA